jgi:hypothetical protein
MMDKKMLKNPMEKKKSLKYIKGLKFKKWVVQKMKGLENPSMLFKVET